MTMSNNGSQILDEYVILIAPSFSRWRGVYQLPRNVVHISLEGREIDGDTVTVPRVKLMTDRFPLDSDGAPWVVRFNRLEAHMKTILESMSVLFPAIRGVRIVPHNHRQRLLDELYRLRDELDAEARQFANQYDDVMQQICQNIDANIWNFVSARVPADPKQMYRKFGLGVVPVRVEAKLSPTVTRVDLDQYEAMVRDTVEATVREAIEAMVAGPRSELAEALSNLDDLVKRGGRVTLRSFEVVRRAIEKIRMFSFVANDDLLQRINDFEQRLGGTDPRSLTADGDAIGRESFRSAIAQLLQEAENEVQITRDVETFSKHRRTVRI